MSITPTTQVEIKKCSNCHIHEAIKACPQCQVILYCSRTCQSGHTDHNDFCDLFHQCRFNPSFNLFSDMENISLVDSSSELSWFSSSSSSTSSSTTTTSTTTTTFTLNLVLEHHLLVMEYLLPLDLCHCSIVNKFWYQMANDQSLWKQNCFLLWQDKQYYNEFLLSSNEKELEKKYENFHKMINELNENNSAQDKKVQKKKKKREKRGERQKKKI